MEVNANVSAGLLGFRELTKTSQSITINQALLRPWMHSNDMQENQYLNIRVGCLWKYMYAVNSKLSRVLLCFASRGHKQHNQTSRKRRSVNNAFQNNCSDSWITESLMNMHDDQIRMLAAILEMAEKLHVEFLAKIMILCWPSIMKTGYGG